MYRCESGIAMFKCGVYAYTLFQKDIYHFNPIPAGALENRIRWGGETPLSKSHVWCPKMTNDTSLESSCALLLESAKKSLQIFNNWIFYRKIQLYSKNVCKKKFVQKMKNYTFLKSPWPWHFNMQKF